MRSILLLLPLTAAAAAAAANCASGLYILVGRGTNEAPGPGTSGQIADAIGRHNISGSVTVAVDYPASFYDPRYSRSEMMGSRAVRDELVRYHDECPGHKMAYIGYSQGAQIGNNAFCGGQGDSFGDQEPLSSAVVQDVVAIVFFGDPSHNKSAPFNRGTSTSNGIFARNNIGACSAYAPKIASFCNKGDVYCDLGANGTVHEIYIQTDGAEATRFIVENYNRAVHNTTSPSPSSTTTTSPSPSSTSSSNPVSPSGSPPTNAAAAAAGHHPISLLFFAALLAVYLSLKV